MKNLLSGLAVLLLVTSNWAQDNSGKNFNRPLRAVHSFAGTANAAFGVSKANFTKNSTNWKHPFGYSISGGVGVAYNMKNSIVLEADFSYELNSFVFNNENVNLSLGYRTPYGDVKIKKILKPDAEDSFYLKGGFGYMFGGTGGVGKDEPTYSYTINFESTSSLLAMFEVGFQKRTNPKNYMDFGVVYKYGFSNIISSTMTYYNPAGFEQASSITKGNYIGISYKYYAIFKMWSKQSEVRRQTDDKF